MTSAATDQLFTPEQVADRLGLHVRTVRRYIREGRLEAVQVGRRYRVTRQALEKFAGIDLSATAPSGTSADVSTIVSLDDIGRATAERLTTHLVASAGGRREQAAPLRLETRYDPARSRLTLMCSGDLAATLALLALVNQLLENER